MPTSQEGLPPTTCSCVEYPYLQCPVALGCGAGQEPVAVPGPSWLGVLGAVSSAHLGRPCVCNIWEPNIAQKLDHREGFPTVICAARLELGVDYIFLQAG